MSSPEAKQCHCLLFMLAIHHVMGNILMSFRLIEPCGLIIICPQTESGLDFLYKDR